MNVLDLVVFLFALATTISGNILPQLQKDIMSMKNQAVKKMDNKPSSSLLFPSQRSSVLPPSQHYYPAYPQYEPPQYRIQTHPESYQFPHTALQSTYQGSSGGWLSTVAANLVPLKSIIITYGTRAIVLISRFIITSIFGFILTTGLCTFTSFCSITFDGFGITHNQVREQVQELARTYVTPENLDVATMLVKTAVETYGKMQQQPDGGISVTDDDNITVMEKNEKRKKRK